MTNRSREPRQPGDRLLRFAKRVCSDRAYERIAKPLLTDLRLEWEDAIRRGRRAHALWIRLTGALRFGQALGLQALGSIRSALTEPGKARREMKLLLGYTLAPFFALTLVFWLSAHPWALPVAGAPVEARAQLALLILPALALVTVPMSLLWGTWSAARHSGRGAAMKTTALMTCLVGLATLFLSTWLVPRANQEYRLAVFTLITGSPGALAPGDREMTFAEVDRALGVPPPAVSSDRANGLRVEWHKRLAIPAACLAFGLLGVGLGRRPRLRSTPWMAALFPAITLSYSAMMHVGETFADRGRVPAGFAVWLPDLLLWLLAAALLMRSPTGDTITGQGAASSPVAEAQ